MTSCVLSLVFLVFFCSSVTAVGTTGIKVRITDRAQNVVKDFGMAILNELVNNPFPDFKPVDYGLKCTLKRLTLTQFEVNPDQVVLNFQQNSGLQFLINNMDFTVEFEYDFKVCSFNLDRGQTTLTGRGLSADINLRLMQNQGRLTVEMSHCETRTQALNLQSNGKIGTALQAFVNYFKDFFKSQLCFAIKSFAIDKAKTTLEALTMVSQIPMPESAAAMINPPGAISIDYSLSGNVAVTANSIDVPFKGLVFSNQADVAGLTGKDPLFTEDNMMAYVGVSDLFFNSIAQALFSIRQFQLEVPHLNWFIRGVVLKGLGLPEGGVVVELTEVPVVTITVDGVSVVVNAYAQSLVPPEKPALPVACTIGVKVDIKGNRLILSTVASNTKCKVRPVTKMGKFWKPIVNLGLKSKLQSLIKGVFTDGVPIPLPEGVDLILPQIVHHDGYLVVRGSLNFTPAGLQGAAHNMANRARGADAIG